MLFYSFITVCGILSCASAAAVNVIRQGQPLQSTTLPQKCPVATLYSYITVTVTNLPGTVTVAVPDYSSISRSLASAHTIDSIVVVEQSQDRPIGNPPDTRIPTFVQTVSAIAFEATEAPHSGNSIVYIPNSNPLSYVDISTNIDSIVLSNFPTIGQGGTQTASSRSTPIVVSPAVQTLTVPSGGWNISESNVASASAAIGSGTVTRHSSTSTLTSTTFVNTTIVNATVTTAPATASPEYSGYGALIKRQTCVLISANIDGHWASWCNNWDGSTTYTYTSWETTVTPGVENPTSSTTSTSTEAATTTVSVTGSATAITETAVTTQSSGVANPTPAPSSGPGASPPVCQGTSSAFTISFDDLSANSGSTNAISGSYSNLFWASGWSYRLPANSPYPPHDGNQLGVYVPAGQSTSPSSSIGDIPLGGFGAGNRSATNAYWFNIQSVWVGCDVNATDPSNACDFVAEGYQYEPSTNTDRIVITQHYYPPLCHSSNCQLQEISFSDSFRQLSALSFYAKANGQIQTFYADALQLSWWNSSCEAEGVRASPKK